MKPPAPPPAPSPSFPSPSRAAFSLPASQLRRGSDASSSWVPCRFHHTCLPRPPLSSPKRKLRDKPFPTRRSPETLSSWLQAPPCPIALHQLATHPGARPNSFPSSTQPFALPPHPSRTSWPPSARCRPASSGTHRPIVPPVSSFSGFGPNSAWWAQIPDTWQPLKWFPTP